MTITMMGGGAAGASDLYGDFETGMYDLEITGIAPSKSELYKDRDGNAKDQVEVQVTLPDVIDPQTGDSLTRKTWLTAVLLAPNPEAKSPRGRQGSQLWRLVLAASGVRCVDGESYNLNDLLVGKRVRALCRLNDKGYPRIDNDSFEAMRAPKAANAPARPAPPKPAAPPDPAMITPNQIQSIRDGWAAGGFGDDAELTKWVADNYGGRGLAQIEANELDGLREALALPPF